MTKLVGDSARLKAIAKKLEAIGGRHFLTGLSENLAEETLSLISEGFRTATDPYGKAWAGKVFPNGKNPLAGRTARLRRGWHPTNVTALGFGVSPSVDYAAYHQFGTGIYGPKRSRIEPTNGDVLSFKIPGRAPKRKRRKRGAAKGKRRRGNWVYFTSVEGSPKRRMIPDGRGTPRKWLNRLERVAVLHLRESMR